MFGNYEIIKTLGQGGMGVVYQAYEPALDREIALKVLREDLRAHKSIVARFQREAEAVASLNHPNIVHIYSVGAVGRIPYIAMEYIDGTALNRIMRKQRRIHWETALEIAEQVARALACAHDARIIHRDIKPGNILVDRQHKAYVTDFGIAKVLSAETQLTTEGSRVGTPQYMSPERCRNKEVTASSDLYSLGVVVFQMIAGRLPFEGESSVDLIRMILSEPPRRLVDFVADIPEEVERLTAYMLEKRVEDRPPDARSLCQAIARVRAGETLDLDHHEAEKALDSFRESMNTPTPLAVFAEADGVWNKFHALWRELPRPARIAVKVIGIVAVVTLATFATHTRIQRNALRHQATPKAAYADRWQESTAAAHVWRENPHTAVARLELQDFDVQQGIWCDGATVAVLLAGRADTARADQAAVYLVEPEAAWAGLYVAPIRLGRRSLELVAIETRATTRLGRGVVLRHGYQRLSRGSWETQLWLCAAPEADQGPKRLDARLFNAVDFRPVRYGEAAAHPGEDRLALDVSLASEGEDNWQLVEKTLRPGSDVAGWPLLENGPRAVSLQYSPSGRELLLLRRGPRQAAVFVLETGRANPPGAKVIEGDLYLNPRAWSPDTQHFALLRTQSDGAREVVTIDVATGDMTSELGEASDCGWSLFLNQIIVVAPDHKGLRQLWAVSPLHRDKRQQLTSLSAGVGEQCYLNEQGTKVWAALEGEPGNAAIVVVDLQAWDTAPRGW